VQVERIGKDALDNFLTLLEAFPNDGRTRQLERLEQWTLDQFGKLTPKLQQRLDGGKVRRCHGDLHLKNIIQMEGRLIAFDGIEFNEEFQWIDILSELAFPVMDFLARGRADLGWRLLNAYLEITGEYETLDLLRFYLVYRAMVRAKVSWLNPKNRAELSFEPGKRPRTDSCAGPWDKYLAVASRFAFDLKPSLAMTHGFSGSGKSTVAMEIIEHEGGIRIRMDVERNRLFKKFEAHDKYSPEMNEWIYTHSIELARSAVEAGFPVIVDAAFLKFEQRQSIEQLAGDLKVDFQIITCDASFEELCRRIRERRGDASEATVDVLKMQMQSHDPLTIEELASVKTWL
jgi:predicted kinase